MIPNIEQKFGHKQSKINAMKVCTQTIKKFISDLTINIVMIENDSVATENKNIMIENDSVETENKNVIIENIIIIIINILYNTTLIKNTIVNTIRTFLITISNFY